MKRYLIFMLVPILLFGKKIEVVNANSLLEIVRNKIVKTRSFSGAFIYTVKNKTFYGAVKFKAPNKFLFNFYGKNSKGETFDTGSKMVSDGKVFWIYLKEQNVAIRESLVRDRKTPMIGWNIDRLTKEYVATIPKEGYKVNFQNIEAYKLAFIPKNSTAGFKYINMIFNTDGDILKMEAQNQLGDKVELIIKYNEFNINISETSFEFSPDENTQIYDNILVPEENKN